MDSKRLLLTIVIIGLLFECSFADFWYNHPSKQYRDPVKLAESKLKCVPGRTTIKVNKPAELLGSDSEEENIDDRRYFRRSHMNHPRVDSEYCEICVCSAEGKDEYCTKRPAQNVNECLRMSELVDNFQKNMPYEHERNLAYRIRRDWIYHDDEIPYASRAPCQRAHSYYTNDPNANNTDIDQASDVDNLLDYKAGADVCFYCVCSVKGQDVYCARRDLWFCEYYRYIRQPDAMREMYSVYFRQDRPTYFRQLSWRLRRTMNDGLNALIEHGGDTMCCDHPAGHRVYLHNSIRNKVLMKLRKNKTPRENLMNGSPGVGSDLDKEKCIPFVSQYSDCVEANLCSGCTRCICTGDGSWACDKVSECGKGPTPPVDEETLDSALNTLLTEVNKESKLKGEPVLQEESLSEGRNTNSKEDLLLDNNEDDIEMQIVKMLSSGSRQKRSIPATKHDNQKNDTVRFYHTVDEINADTLKNSNLTGTLGAAKVEPNIPFLSRRTGTRKQNISDSTLDEIPKDIELQITDNKIDVQQVNESIDHLEHYEVGIISNFTQKEKDNEISKLVVNELKGQEYIGDKNAPVMSNITFTPENDTLTAMAFIAGNLLNKLWSMERDSEESIETEIMKQEKIADLLDLFKDPLTLRQEEFLKNALEKLSQAMDKKKEVSNHTLCEDIIKAKHFLSDAATSNWEKKSDVNNNYKRSKNNSSADDKTNVKTQALAKIKEVMSMITKIDKINEALVNLKSANEQNKQPNMRTSNFTEEGRKTKNIFGSILEKITKLLLPDKHSKKLISKIRRQYVLNDNDDDVKKKFKKAFNFDLTNVTLSAKDKLILDYLTKIRSDPSLLFNSDIEYKSPSSIYEGEIMMNLSEFFKIKSFIDLMKLLDEDKKETKKKTLRQNETSTVLVTDEVELTTKPTNQIIDSSTNSPKSIGNTKNKLKKHLKTILEDLVELQKEKGTSTKEGEIKIADALPCIYKLLHSSNNSTNNNGKNNKERLDILKVLGEMREELQIIQNDKNTRRTLATLTADRPKSAAVWERVVNNVDFIQKKTSRRFPDNSKPKSYEELKKMMDQVESRSKLYKTNALQFDVPAAEKLMLLKTMEHDVKQYTKVLENIKISLENDNKITQEQYQELKEFIFNAGFNLKLNGKVASSLNKSKVNPELFKHSLIPKLNKQIIYKQSSRDRLAEVESDASQNVLPKSNARNVQITRDDLLNQLIRNKVNQFIRTKEEEKDFTGINYGLAKNIVENLDKGEEKLARELYKVFVNNKLITPKAGNIRDLESPSRHKPFDKEPLLRFAEPNTLPAPMPQSVQTKTNDLLRQLLNLQTNRRSTR